MASVILAPLTLASRPKTTGPARVVIDTGANSHNSEDLGMNIDPTRASARLRGACLVLAATAAWLRRTHATAMA